VDKEQHPGDAPARQRGTASPQPLRTYQELFVLH
jgi:hypothetical protein